MFFQLQATQDNVDKENTVANLYSFKPYKWSQVKAKNDVVPIGRSGHRIVHFNNSIYVFGGYNPDNVITNNNDDEHWEEVCKSLICSRTYTLKLALRDIRYILEKFVNSKN